MSMYKETRSVKKRKKKKKKNIQVATYLSVDKQFLTSPQKLILQDTIRIYS